MAVRRSIAVSLPAPLQQWVDQVVAEHGYADAGEYLGELIRDDRKRQLKGALEQRLLAAVGSSPPRELTSKAWQDLRSQAKAAATRRRKRVA